MIHPDTATAALRSAALLELLASVGLEPVYDPHHDDEPRHPQPGGPCMTTAAEHYDWTIARAREYLDAGDHFTALASLISDLNKHPGTAGLLHRDLRTLAVADALVTGGRSIRDWVEGLPRPDDERSG